MDLLVYLHSLILDPAFAKPTSFIDPTLTASQVDFGPVVLTDASLGSVLDTNSNL